MGGGEKCNGIREMPERKIEKEWQNKIEQWLDCSQQYECQNDKRQQQRQQKYNTTWSHKI